MKKGLNEIILIIDKSGSMGSVKDDAIGGYNEFIKKQKEDKDCETQITTVLFDTDFNTIYENTDVKDVELLTEQTYVPSGCTALLDAVGQSIDDVGKRLANTSDENRPEKVIVCILTDGKENSSCKYNRDKIKEMIEHQKDKYKWEFIFLGANQDAFAEAGSIGIARGDTQNYVSDSIGTRQAFACMSDASLNYKAKNI